MPKRIRDFGVASLVLAGIFATAAMIDERVPEYVQGVASDAANGRLIQTGSPVGNLFATLSANPALDNFFVVAMVAVGGLLFLLMLRT